MFTCDCGKRITMPAAHGEQRNVMIGLSCECGVYWDLHYPIDALFAMAVRWTCPTCGSSKQMCKSFDSTKCGERKGWSSKS